MNDGVLSELPLQHPVAQRQMALVLDRVWAALPTRDRSDETRRELARLVVAWFERGGRDPERLIGLILSELVLERANALCA